MLTSLWKRRKMAEIPADIPVIIDETESFEGHNLTRCTYYSVESGTPMARQPFGTDPAAGSFLFEDKQTVIVKALTGRHFRHHSEISQLIGSIEKHDDFFVNINTIHLPNELFEMEVYCRRGSVYRIRADLFRMAVAFRRNEISLEEFIPETKPSMIHFSESETRVFEAWEHRQIGLAFENYHIKRDLALSFDPA